jgi:hypothetical protein
MELQQFVSERNFRSNYFHRDCDYALKCCVREKYSRTDSYSFPDKPGSRDDDGVQEHEPKKQCWPGGLKIVMIFSLSFQKYCCKYNRI